ncbi:hypothetical protein IEQ34_011505 [Dendrobium chrysotoxum]|uniref:Uncharacterized protein n=1 Tax=Dendrobium chrysotoxum TaxID=161865 RepID=A0AAV7GRU7_DENCH|nr:hypothetical protein IEQ34_011505 [Dendrobium chrysotoxum]
MEMSEKEEEHWIWNEGWPQPGEEEKGKEEGGEGKGGQGWPPAGCGEQGLVHMIFDEQDKRFSRVRDFNDEEID